MDYKEIADQIIIAIGGQDNVKYVTHCVTRLRFVLKNKNLVNQDKKLKIFFIPLFQIGESSFSLISSSKLSSIISATSKL